MPKPYKKLFLFRLYQHSKLAFAIAMLFILFYILLFSKKMDMVIFRYNNMFAVPTGYSGNAYTYAVKVNGHLVKITDKPYWKKDFLEASLSTYVHYTKNNKTTFLHQYLQQKIKKERVRQLLLQKLTADSVSVNQFLPWYIEFAPHKSPENAKQLQIELWQYHYAFNSTLDLKDSVLVQQKYATPHE